MVMNSGSRYQCPHCARSYIEKRGNKKGRFCTCFSVKLTEQEALKANFVFDWFGMKLTRECKWVYRGRKRNCSGFQSNDV